MANQELIPIELFCATCHVELAVIDAMADNGLLQITVVGTARYIAPEQLGRAERMVRLHDDLGINVEGLDAIEHLLSRMEEMQQQLQDLRNRLRRYELGGH